MKRDLGLLTSKVFDVLVVGGGIHGACVAWDATLRGLSVALIDKGDFGHATSANSLKIIHGGLRYLQDPDIMLARTMMFERMAFMRIAPHLVHPIPCIMPLYRGMLTSKPVMKIALAANDALSVDRHWLSAPDKRLPRARVISRVECLHRVPGIHKDGLTGAALWYDSQMYNSERLTLSFVLAAARCGAAVANYVEMTAFTGDDRTVRGVKVRDGLSGAVLEVRAKVVINTAGPWTDSVLALLQDGSRKRPVCLSRAINLITRQIIPSHIVALPSRYHVEEQHVITKEKARLLVMAPWHSYSLLGTLHLPFEGDAPVCYVEESEVNNFITQFNLAYPGASITRSDVRFVHTGLLPIADERQVGHVRLRRKPQILDHRIHDGLEGLITVVGVKYTLARRAAQAAVDVVLRKLGQEPRACLTAEVPIAGGQVGQFSTFIESEMASQKYALPTETLRHLIYTYGSHYIVVADYIKKDQSQGGKVSEGHEVTKAEIVHAIREEMAVKLADVIFRRTELGAAGSPSDACLRACAAIMAAELRWTQATVAQELQEVRGRFAAAA